jgi:hypothetical protein
MMIIATELSDSTPTRALRGPNVHVRKRRRSASLRVAPTTGITAKVMLGDNAILIAQLVPNRLP